MSKDPNTVIFINSKQRISGVPWDFYINFNDNLIKAPKGCYIQITVEQASINRSWYSIQSGYNTFQITDNLGGNQTITIPIGYYNATDLRTQLQSQLTTWTITYDKKLNKYTFTAPAFTGGITWRKFVFTNSSVSDLFGFDQTETPQFTSASPSVVSSKPIKVNEDNCILVRTNLPRQKMSALDNLNRTIVESDVLCSIPIQNAPFDNIVYDKNNSCDFVYNVLSPTVHGLRIYLTNEQGIPLQVPYDWWLVLSIDYIPYAQDDSKPVLENIRDMVRLFMLHTFKFDDGNEQNQIISQ